jgi:ABC-2 type transport system permease protein
MIRVAAIAHKEAQQFLRDRLILFIAAALPIVLMTLYGTALSMNPRNLRLVVDDQDQSATSRRYVEAFAATNKFVLVPRSLDGPPERMIEAGEARAVLRIPPQFGRDFLAGGVPEAQLLIDGTESNAALILRSIHSAVARSFASSGGAAPLQVRVRHWYNPGLSDALFFGSGALGLVLMLFPALLGALSTSREHELGTVTQVYASTLRAPEWILGKAAPYWLTGVLQLGICFAVGRLVFGYHIPEHPMPMLCGGLIYLLTAVFYGMLVGNLTRIQSAAYQGVQLGAFLFSMLMSGFLMPLANAPWLMQVVSNIVPARHFIEVTRDIMVRGGDWDTSARPLVALVLLTLLFFGANIGRLRRMQMEE